MINSTPKVHMLILNFNGKDLLADFLPSIIAAAKNSHYNCKVSVIDNASSDGSVEYLKVSFGQVTVLTQATNRVLCAYNDCVGMFDDDVVIFLNNDIKVDINFVDPLVETFLKGQDIFMVTPKTLDGEGRINGSITKAYIKWGIFWSGARYPGFEKDVDKEDITFSAGGITAFDRVKFIELGGYDDLYLPGTVEDSDICFRAWKRGWKCIYQPKSVVYHMGQVSFVRRFGMKKTRIINFRNVFLFMWKNISDFGLICEHIIFTPIRLLYALVTGRTELCAGYLQAMVMVVEALRRRRSMPSLSARTDREIFGLFKV